MRIRRLFALLSVVSAMVIPMINGTVMAVEFQPCFRDLSLNKQVQVPGSDFIDAHTSGAAPNATVGDTVTWKITVTNVTSGSCETFDLPGTIVMHDVLPTGFSFVSSSDPSGYDSSTNDWKFLAISASNPLSPATLTIVTTANQAGVFENVATLTSLITCVQQGDNVECTTHNYAIDSEDDPMQGVKDKNIANDSSKAWVRVQIKPQVLGESTTTPQVLAASTLVNTGSSTVVSAVVATMLFVATVSLGYVSRRSRRQQI